MIDLRILTAVLILRSQEAVANGPELRWRRTRNRKIVYSIVRIMRDFAGGDSALIEERAADHHAFMDLARNDTAIA